MNAPLSIWRTLPPNAPRRTPQTRSGRPSLGGEAGAMLRATAEANNLTPDELIGQSRKRRVCQPRQELMFRMYETGRYSLPLIGQFLGGRDHTTILHGVRAHRKRMAERAQP